MRARSTLGTSVTSTGNLTGSLSFAGEPNSLLRNDIANRKWRTSGMDGLFQESHGIVGPDVHALGSAETVLLFHFGTSRRVDPADVRFLEACEFRAKHA